MIYKFITDDMINDMLDDVLEIKFKCYFQEFSCND